MTRYHGDPRNLEPDKCSDLRYFRLEDLPSPLFPPSVPFLDHAQARAGINYRTEVLCLRLVSQDASSNRDRFTTIRLVGANHYLVMFSLGRRGERQPRQLRQHSFDSRSAALEFIRREVHRRISHDYELAECSGSASIDGVVRLLPSKPKFRIGAIEELAAPEQLFLGDPDRPPSFDEI